MEYKIIQPEPDLSDFVERIYMVQNTTPTDKEVVLIPDGRIDIFYILTETEHSIATLIGLETQCEINVTIAYTEPKIESKRYGYV